MSRTAAAGGFTWADGALMRRALRLAARGAGATSPNPMVGAVLAVGEEVVAEGYHARFGGPHAERRLLASLGARGKQAPARSVLYLSLEPCTYHGKTPPCVEALLGTRIRRAVIATKDPNPIVTGRGIRALRRAGWEVRTGLLSEEARRLIRPFTLAAGEGRARVTLKIASTLDGMLADHEGGSRWITGPEARQSVRWLRSWSDAIVVGRGTVEIDDPRLRPRTKTDWSPSRIVVDERLSVDPDCRLARLWRREVAGSPAVPTGATGNWVPVPSGRGGTRWIRRPRLIVATATPDERRLRRFTRKGWEVWQLPNLTGRVDLPGLARRAAREGLIDLLVEPGPELAGGFLRNGPVDRIFLYLAPKILGGDKSWGGMMQALPLARALHAFPAIPPLRVGEDLLLCWEGPGGAALVPPRRGGRNALESL